MGVKSRDPDCNSWENLSKLHVWQGSPQNLSNDFHVAIWHGTQNCHMASAAPSAMISGVWRQAIPGGLSSDFPQALFNSRNGAIRRMFETFPAFGRSPPWQGASRKPRKHAPKQAHYVFSRCVAALWGHLAKHDQGVRERERTETRIHDLTPDPTRPGKYAVRPHPHSDKNTLK